jgi:hypothetical protein
LFVIILCFLPIKRILIEELLPNPQYRYGANDAEDEVGKITLAKQFYVQQIADDGAGITAHNTYE